MDEGRLLVSCDARWVRQSITTWRLNSRQKVEGFGREMGEALNKDAGIEHRAAAGDPCLAPVPE